MRMVKSVSKIKAEKVLEAIKAWMSTFDPDGAKELKLRDYTHEEQSKGSWSIAAELGWEWPMSLCEAVAVKTVKLPGVFVEPMTMWCLGVYPDDK